MADLIRPISEQQRERFAECHADGHQWRHEGIVGAPDWMPPLGMQSAIARHSICTSCGSERARWLTRSGEVLNRYRHADGYLHKRSAPDDFAPSRQEWRRQLAVTLFARFDEQASRQAAPRRARKRAAS